MEQKERRRGVKTVKSFRAYAGTIAKVQEIANKRFNGNFSEAIESFIEIGIEEDRKKK